MIILGLCVSKLPLLQDAKSKKVYKVVCQREITLEETIGQDPIKFIVAQIVSLCSKKFTYNAFNMNRFVIEKNSK
jgi:hypothetical protein